MACLDMCGPWKAPASARALRSIAKLPMAEAGRGRNWVRRGVRQWRSRLYRRGCL